MSCMNQYMNQNALSIALGYHICLKYVLRYQTEMLMWK